MKMFAQLRGQNLMRRSADGGGEYGRFHACVPRVPQDVGPAGVGRETLTPPVRGHDTIADSALGCPAVDS